MRSRYRRLVAALGVAILTVSMTACNPARSGGGNAANGSADGPGLVIKAAAPSLTIAVPLTMVINRTDAAHGIDVDLQASGTSSTNVIDAVIANQVEYGSAGTPSVLHAIREGADLKIVAAVVDNLQVLVLRTTSSSASAYRPALRSPSASMRSRGSPSRLERWARRIIRFCGPT
jgi:ABC-type nitrate/sulfonate/bicarbonate transport system substrate-binding protein